MSDQGKKIVGERGSMYRAGSQDGSREKKGGEPEKFFVAGRQGGEKEKGEGEVSEA